MTSDVSSPLRPLARLRRRLASLPVRLPQPPLGPLLRRLPLRCTALATTALLLTPALLLHQRPRPRAEGLGRLLPHAALLQSVPADPLRPVPQLWRQRLAAAGAADRLWRQQRGPWWQFWGRDGAGGAYLVLPLPRAMAVGSEPLPANSLRIDGLLLVAASPLAQRLAADQLRAAPRQQRGLQGRCLDNLQRRQAAYWSADGLGAMAGPLAPLLQGLQEGCLVLGLDGAALALEGEVAATTGLLAAAPLALGAGALPPPLADDRLLQLRGRSLEPLLRGFLSRQLIREPLAASYGLAEPQLALLRRSPFQLRLRPVANGPFHAGLELVLLPSGGRARWDPWLEGLADRLVERGLEPLAGSPRTWRDDQQRTVGGWRWLPGPSPDQPLLHLFLGPVPAPVANDLRHVQHWQRLPELELQARPQALVALGLLPAQLPLPLQQAAALQAVLESGPAQGEGGTGGLTRLLARLQLLPR